MTMTVSIKPGETLTITVKCGDSTTDTHYVIPALEKIINTVSTSAKKIDEKVPDVPPVPPGSTTDPPQ